VKVFISHSHKQRELAKILSSRLRAANYETFHDATDLTPGTAYDQTIREQIAHCDLFMFLLSPDSIRPGSFALSELLIAEAHWPNPTRRVLPVEVVPTDITDVPAYLKAVTILRPQGELAADVLRHLAGFKPRPVAKTVLAGAGAVALMVFTVVRIKSGETGTMPALLDAAVGRVGLPVATGGPDAALDQRREPSNDGRVIHPHTPPTFPIKPSSAIMRSLFPATHRCRPQIESEEGRFFLVCRCDASAFASAALELRQPDWQLAAEQASLQAWSCP
jgi:hypothetical protein